jgi:hypothetical protein
VNQARLTAAAICTISPQRVTVRRAVAFQAFDTPLGVVTLMPGDYVIRLPTGEEIPVAAKDAVGWINPTDANAAALFAARPIELVADQLPAPPAPPARPAA